MINLEALQTAAVWAHENDIESDDETEFVNLQDAAIFVEKYAQLFGLHPSSVLVGLRLGYLALMAAEGIIAPKEEEEPQAEEESEGLVPLVLPETFGPDD